MQNQEKIWDKVAPEWEEYRKNLPKKQVLDFLKGKKGKILDLGCGSGRHFKKSKQTEFYGTDISQKMLDIAETKNIAIELKKSPADKIPYPDDFFESAIYIATLQCVHLKEKRIKSLKELYRVLKPKSKTLISVINKNHKRVKNKLTKTKEVQIPWTCNGKKIPRYYYIYNKTELEKQLKQAKFKIIKSWEDNHFNNIFVIIEKN